MSRRTKPVAIRGAFSFETVADNLVKIGPARLTELFNGATRCLAKQGMLPKRIDAVLDATDDEATPTSRASVGSPKESRGEPGGRSRGWCARSSGGESPTAGSKK